MYSRDRGERLKAIETLRDSRVVTLITSVRENWAAQLADEQVRVIYDHLLRIRGNAARLARLDLFIMSNGGDSLVPWRLISVFREFADHIGVLVPYRAYSAATLTALGADDIVMGPFGQLGPIDPTVQNDFNPIDERTNQKIGVSVEDVKSFIQFVKTTVGITHEDELIRAVEALLAKVHPLALGNVERFIQQSRMIAHKLLRTHMSEDSDKHLINEIIENMASKLYFHGHPISRSEARSDLQLKNIEQSDRTMDDALWSLYLEYETFFDMRAPVNPAAELAKSRVAAQGQTTPYQAAYDAAILAGAPMPQAVQLALAHVNAAGTAQPISYELDAPAVAIESTELSSVLKVRQRWELIPETTPGQTMVRQELLEQRWLHSEVPGEDRTAGDLTATAPATPGTAGNGTAGSATT